MGRLTLNVLLSFAQFEREVTSERIRDKIAASKKRGLWVGGMVPLGYASQDKKLVIVEEEAERVRLIFRRYLELGSLDKLLVDLRETGIVTKVRPLSNGRTIGGIPFTRGPLAYLLRNRFYIGEIVYRGSVCPAEHDPILDRDLFEAVQARLTEQHRSFTNTRSTSQALLRGKLFDDRGNRMTPTHALKRGTRYRYYTSCALNQGRPSEVGSVPRVAARPIEAAILAALRARSPELAGLEPAALIDRQLRRAVLTRHTIEIQLAAQHAAPAGSTAGADRDGDDDGDDAQPILIAIPFDRAPTRRAREILIPASSTRIDARPIRSETRATLVRSIALGRRWLNEIVTGNAAGPEAIAARERCTPRHVTKLMSLAFLAPDLVQAAIDGRLPRGVGVSRLTDAPIEWSRQWYVLGL